MPYVWRDFNYSSSCFFEKSILLPNGGRQKKKAFVDTDSTELNRTECICTGIINLFCLFSK